MEDHYLNKTAAQVDALLDQITENDERLDAIVTGSSGNYTLKAADTIKIGGAKVANMIGDIGDSYTGVCMEGTSKVLYVPKSYNSTITIQKNGSEVGSFTLNQNSGQNINITVPTIPSDIGAQEEITNNTKLSSDLVDDTNATNLFVTDNEKSAWNAKSDFSGSYNDLTDKPTLGTASALNVPASGDAATTEVVKGDDSRLTDARHADDVYSWAKAANKPAYSSSEVSDLSNLTTTDKTSLVGAVNELNAIIGDVNTVLEEVL